MTESMKFGPEWLRNLTGDGCNTGGGGLQSLRPPRFPLAKHRYGREEMLALFDHSACHPPDTLTAFSSLYVEKTQEPLALINMTEDETRLWNGGVTSTGVGRGRGTSVDRGGRQRSTRSGSGHFRGIGYDDLGENPRNEPTSFAQGRTRAFDRPQADRGWTERNGVLDTNDWNGSTSPRKELSRGLSGGSLMESNWRRHRTGSEDEDAWRLNSNRADKWVRGSWRDAGGLDREAGEEDGNKPSGRREHKGSHRPYDSHNIPTSRRSRNSGGHHDFHDNLPEWVTENTGDSSGSFDASGAFHGMYSDDDDDKSDRKKEPRIRRTSEGSALNNSSRLNSNNKIYNSADQESSSGQNRSAQEKKFDSSNPSINEENSKLLQPFEINTTNNQSQENIDKLLNPNTEIESPSNLSDQNTLNSSTTPLKPPGGFEKQANFELLSASPPKSEKNIETAASIKDENQSSKVKVQQPQTNVSKNKENLQANQLDIQNNKEISTNISSTSKAPSLMKPNTTIHNSTSEDNNDDKDKTEDNLNRMEEEVAKLIDSNPKDEPPKVMSSKVKNSNNSSTTIDSGLSQEKWFYRDPQGEVQGPFLASEMAEWWKQGYFSQTLLLRRSCDERYTTLGDLMKICGRVPFKPGPVIPPLKLSDTMIPPGGIPAGIPNSALPKPGIEDPLLMLQYQQLRLLQNQQMFLKQLQTNATTKLSQSEHWSTLTPVEQSQLILQYMRSMEPDFTEAQMATVNSFMPSVPHHPPPSSSVMQLFPQLQQTIKQQSENVQPQQNVHVTSSSVPSTLDPVQQLMQQVSGIRNMPPIPTPAVHSSPAPPSQEDNPIKSWLRQMGMNSNTHNPTPPQVESVWPPAPPPHLNAFNHRNWMPQVGSLPSTLPPPGQMHSSLWDIHPKDIKTEQQILEEQKLKEEKRKKEELRQFEEAKKIAKAKEEAKCRQMAEEIDRLKAEKLKREEAERKRKEEEKKRREEENRKREEELKFQLEEKRKEEERRREEKRKLEEEINRKKQELNRKIQEKLQEEERKRREELKRQEEKLKKEEEKRKKLEEELLRKQEEERLRKEEEVRKKAEAEENARKAEQRRREVEALRKLQERSKAPWAQAPAPPPTVAQAASLAEIQRLEREKKVEEQRLQMILQQQQLAQQKAIEAANQEALALDSSKRLQFKWAEKIAPISTVPQIKSLAQIQQEEQERMFKFKQQEREKLEKEKQIQKEANIPIQNVSIWGTASQSLNWTNPSPNSNQTWMTSDNVGGGGFWDDPAPKVNVPKAPLKQQIITKSPTAPQQQTQVLQQQQQITKSGKSKTKKEEELVKKLFEQNTAKTDDFTQWCNKALSGLQVSVDIPTFIGFLRDIEAAYEVKEYVRMYLGDGKQCAEFAKQFLEKRSKWRSSQRPQAQADDLCKPAPAVNPNASTDFQEVKSKSKKPKKGKMFKVDSRMLGFSVMSAPDRINVGDRDYGEGV